MQPIVITCLEIRVEYAEDTTRMAEKSICLINFVLIIFLIWL